MRTRKLRLLFILSVVLIESIVTLGAPVAGDQETKLHRTFHLGASLLQLRPMLDKDCVTLAEHHYTGKMAAPYGDQVQVDCDGLEVLGARRKVEFMFDDGSLGHLWVLIAAPDRRKVLSVLLRVFGPAVYDGNGYKVFASGNAALRDQPAEVLIARRPIILRLTGYAGSSVGEQ